MLTVVGDYLAGEDLEAAVASDFSYFVALYSELFL